MQSRSYKNEFLSIEDKAVYCEFDDIAFTNTHNYCYLMNLLDEFCNVVYSIVLSQKKYSSLNINFF